MYHIRNVFYAVRIYIVSYTPIPDISCSSSYRILAKGMPRLQIHRVNIVFPIFRIMRTPSLLILIATQRFVRIQPSLPNRMLTRSIHRTWYRLTNRTTPLIVTMNETLHFCWEVNWTHRSFSTLKVITLRNYFSFLSGGL